MYSNLFERIKKDTAFRIKLFLRLSFIFNTAYSLFLFVISQAYSSKWFLATAIYYGLLSITRLFIFKRLSNQNELMSNVKTMRACGIFLFFINIAFSVMASVFIYETQSAKHHEITVITLATYTFSSLTLAIINGVKYFKKNDYLHSSAKFVSLISASVSLVTLTNTMLSTFGENNESLKNTILPLLSFAVSIFIINCAVAMIRKANFDLRILKNEQKRK